MILVGLATGASSLTEASGFLGACGSRAFAAASTLSRLAMSGSPGFSGQRCGTISESAGVTSSASPPCTTPSRSLSNRHSFIRPPWTGRTGQSSAARLANGRIAGRPEDDVRQALHQRAVLFGLRAFRQPLRIGGERVPFLLALGEAFPGKHV